jgi:hypothetical protein
MVYWYFMRALLLANDSQKASLRKTYGDWAMFKKAQEDFNLNR